MIRIAFIDERIQLQKLSFDNEIEELSFIGNYDNCPQDDWYPEDSHSAKCIWIFEEYCKTKDLVKIFNLAVKEPNKNGSVCDFVEALKWCEKNRIDVINVSIGSVSDSDREIISKAVEKLIKKDILVCAAISNRNEYTYPASLKGVIGVKHNIRYFHGRLKCVENSDLGVNIEICSQVRITTKKGDIIDLPPSNSYATPIISAKIVDQMNCCGKVNRSEYMNMLRQVQCDEFG